MQDNDDKKVSVTSHNQSGGITAHTVHVNAAPEPTLHTKALFANRLENGEYHTQLALRVDSPYPPSNLFIAVHAHTIRRIDLQPQRSGMVMMGHCGNREGMSFANLQQPFGVIHLDIYTGAPEQPTVEWDLT